MGKAVELPTWVKPQLTRNVDEAPAGDDWLHEIKYDGYRVALAASEDRLSRRRAVRPRPDGVPAFSRLQAAMDERRTGDLVFFAFDLLFLDDESTAKLQLIERKKRLRFLGREVRGVRFADHVLGDGLSRVHWVRPEVVVEVTYLTWTEGGLLCAVSYQGAA